MFGKPVKEESAGIGEIIAFIGKGVRVEGKLIFDGTVRIDGQFKGEAESNGTLVVGEGALVEATLNIDTIVVSGEIRGVINAKSRVELRGPGKVLGDIRTPDAHSWRGRNIRGQLPDDKKGFVRTAQ